MVLSQFIRLLYDANHYCSVSTSKRRLVPTPLPSIPKTVINTPTSLLQRTPSKTISSGDESNYLYSLSSSVDVDLMMILTMIIIPTILVIILTILPMMLLEVPDIIGTHKELDIFPNTNTARPTTVLMTIYLDNSLSSTSPHESSKRKELYLQQQQFWAFTQKLHYSRIGSYCFGFIWITAILYKSSIPI